MEKIKASLANPEDFEDLMQGKKNEVKEEIINYSQPQFFDMDQCMNDYFECEKCEDLHRQGETCDRVVEQNLGQNTETSTTEKERTYMTDSEDEDRKGAQCDRVVSQNLGQITDTSITKKERTYMTDSEDEDFNDLSVDKTKSLIRVLPNEVASSNFENVREKTYMSDTEDEENDSDTDLVIDDNVVFVEEQSD